MRVLVACEFSGVVRRAFRALGHDAFSCDLLPAEDASEFHYQCDVKDLLGAGWDMMIAHPPCTYLCASGIHWNSRRPGRDVETEKALAFFRELLFAPIPRICIENPVGIVSSRLCKPSQIIHPWQFGHGETKTTCLWLRGLSLLQPTKIVSGRSDRLYKLSSTKKDRWAERSRTYEGIAAAMAAQWSHSGGWSLL